jgi:hypothetical protein
MPDFLSGSPVQLMGLWSMVRRRLATPLPFAPGQRFAFELRRDTKRTIAESYHQSTRYVNPHFASRASIRQKRKEIRVPPDGDFWRCPFSPTNRLGGVRI